MRPTDGPRTTFLPELPLYVENMERGDYSIYGWPALGGADLGLEVNQTYNADPEIGRLLRTKDFRIAMSHALNREGINETGQLGLGVIQNREFLTRGRRIIPADDSLTQLYMDHGPDKANKMLDDLGLSNKDSKGFRTLPNGERLSINFVFSGSHGRPVIGELLKAHLAEVGIDVSLDISGEWYKPFRAVDRVLQHQYEPVSPHRQPVDALPDQLHSVPRDLLRPRDADREVLWTDGEEGMAPVADPSFLPLAPPNAFPADHAGWFKSLHEDTIAGFANSTFDPARVELGKNMYRNHAENLLAVHVSAFSKRAHRHLPQQEQHEEPAVYTRAGPQRPHRLGLLLR